MIPLDFRSTETDESSVIEMLNAPIPEELISHVESPKIADLRTKIQMAHSAEKKDSCSKMEIRKYVNRLSAQISREKRKIDIQSLKQECTVLEEEQAFLKSKLRQTQIQNNILQAEVKHWKTLTESVPREIHAALGYSDSLPEKIPPT